jgi:hypothetical protein
LSADDWPIVVASVSAILEPSQSIDRSPEMFRKGRMASDTDSASWTDAIADDTCAARGATTVRYSTETPAATMTARRTTVIHFRDPLVVTTLAGWETGAAISPDASSS